MSFKSLITLALLLVVPAVTSAGAWDAGPFDNDDALDWVWELTDSDDLSAVEMAIDGVFESPGYIEAPTASMAIAAAEVLAALAGKPAESLPDEVTSWVESNDLEVSKAMTDKARKAIKLVMDGESSELAQLWGDAPELASAWRASLESLMQRLE